MVFYFPLCLSSPQVKFFNKDHCSIQGSTLFPLGPLAFLRVSGNCLSGDGHCIIKIHFKCKFFRPNSRNAWEVWYFDNSIHWKNTLRIVPNVLNVRVLNVGLFALLENGLEFIGSKTGRNWQNNYPENTKNNNSERYKQTQPKFSKCQLLVACGQMFLKQQLDNGKY